MHSGQSYRHVVLGVLLTLAGLGTAVTCWASTDWPPPPTARSTNRDNTFCQADGDFCVTTLCATRNDNSEQALFQCGNTIWNSWSRDDQRLVGTCGGTSMAPCTTY